MRHHPLLVLTALAAAAGCTQPDELAQVPEPPPISGGTLHISPGGRWAIASDPARACIHVVDLPSRSQTARVDLDPLDEPGRIAEGADGTVYVVLRRAGQVARLDPAAGRIVGRTDVCAAPRGIDVDPDTGEVIVACAEGLLVRMSPGGEVLRRMTVEPDLRDVVAQSGGVLWVSRFRSAQVLRLQGDEVVQRYRPDADEATRRVLRDPTVAWRMRDDGAGGVVLLHQQSVSSQLGSTTSTGAPYYSGGCRVGIVRPAITPISRVQVNDSIPFDDASLAVDLVSVSGEFYIAAASEPGFAIDDGRYVRRNGVRRVQPATFPGGTCRTSDEVFGGMTSVGAAATAVAATPSGELVAQFRDPPMLVVGSDRIDLDGGSVAHFGHALFHEAAGTGMTCASCHPEGAEDGHVWQFDIGTRRTQTLTGGISSTAPFHWQGNVPDVSHVLDGTFVGRMSGTMPQPLEVESFARWMDSLPALPGRAEPSDATARGRDAFDRASCGTCHSGELRTNNESVDVGTGGQFQVPALYEVQYHTPYMHDGSHQTLDSLVAAHGSADILSSAERSDLVVYLSSL